MRRVAINAQLDPRAGSGGVQYALAGLLSALGHLTDGPEEYVVIGPPEGAEWLRPYLGPNMTLVQRPIRETAAERESWIKRGLRPLKPLIRQIQRAATLPRPKGYPFKVPLSNGFYESLNCGVIHFPYQEIVICAIPSVFSPHDLQHLHYPQFFDPTELAQRETMYPAGCRFAHTVVVPSQWVKNDLARNYQISPEKIQVIPWAPPTATYPHPDPETIERTKTKYNLGEPFIFYPAIPWPHKNHRRLLEAMALVGERERVRVRLVCTGARGDLFEQVLRQAEALNLHGQVRYLGAVEPIELRAIYRLAAFVIIPTLFEGGAMPILEAWQDAAPVACSAVTMMPEQAGEAALLFDPAAVDSIADAMLKLWTSDRLRAEFARLGAKRLRHFTWQRTAKAYRAVYRRAAGWPLTEADRTLLSWDWMREPELHGTDL